jgi:hypothetical protein
VPAVIAAEDRGYDYFSGLSDPNLVRVVQYAAMYQIFSAFNIARSSESIPADSYPDQLLETTTKNLSDEIRKTSNSDLDILAKQTASTIAASFEDQVTAQELAKFQATARRQLELIKFDLPATDPRDAAIRGWVLSQFASNRKMPQRYAEAIARRAKGWIHTPVVVISRNRDIKYQGGHNLDARVSKVVADRQVQPGLVRIDAKGNLMVNPRDLPRARGLARSIERDGLIDELVTAAREHDPLKLLSVQMEMRNALSRAEVIAVHPRETALHFGSVPPKKPPVNKPLVSAGEPGPAGGAGWGGEGRDSKLIPITPEHNRPNAIRFKLGEDARYGIQYRLADGKQAIGVAGLTHEDAVDATVWQAIRRGKPGEPVVIEFQNMPEHKAWATLRTMEIRMRDQGQAVELIGLLPGKDGSPAVISKQFDFAKAAVEAPEIKTLTTGELQQDISLRVPGIENNNALSFTSEIRFNKWTPRNVVSAVKERVSTAFNGLATRWSRLARNITYHADVKAYNVELARAVKKIKSRTKLDFEVKTNFSVGPDQGLRDSLITQKERPNGEYVSADVAGQSE